MSAAVGAADISAGHEPRQQADPPDRRQHGFTVACCTSVMVAVMCVILGFPCAPTGVAVLDSVPVFRCTCVGFAAFTVLGALLPRSGAADVSFRIAITFNSLAFWWVTFAWCMDDYSWWGILVLEHAFIALAVATFLSGKGMLAQLAFTALGALTSFVRSSERDDFGAQPLSNEDEEVWATTIMAAVSMLVACMMAARWAVFKKQPGATAARVTPEPKEAREAWAGVVPAGPIPAGPAPVAVGMCSTDMPPFSLREGPSSEQPPLSSEQPSEQQGHMTPSSGALRGVSSISSDPASPAGAGAGGAAPSGPDLSVPEDLEAPDLEAPGAAPSGSESSRTPTASSVGTPRLQALMMSGTSGLEDRAFSMPVSEADFDTLPDLGHTLQIPAALPWADASEAATWTGVAIMTSETTEYANQPYTSEDVWTTADCESVLCAVSETSTLRSSSRR